ncbi:MAG: exonuclease subunit SbcC [Prochloron sp. SP5CPC1]|nr:exonuclease subunit SbcC [Candidatus Paraprochloron terpiosi SP5CPC1]
MIPLELTLKNFLSYREATLDFRGLHTACICGANGAGKSGLLDAITWVIWGKSRASYEEDVIHTGEKNVRVDFEFICNGETYRIIRTRERGRSCTLEFQVKSHGGYKTLSLKGLRPTQQLIITSLKLDYDTFINSAYLRQGRANEFMLRRASERKQILAQLLKLERYEELAGKAKDISKEYKGKVEQLEESLEPLGQQLERKEAIISQLTTITGELTALEERAEEDKERLQELQRADHGRQTAQQQLIWYQNQQENLCREYERLSLDHSQLQSQLKELAKVLSKEREITANYNQLLKWQEEEETLAAKFTTYQNVQQQRQELEGQLIKRSNEFKVQISQSSTYLETLAEQEKEQEQVLRGAEEVEAALKKLHILRCKLQELDDLQHQVSPLLQQRQTLEREIQLRSAKRTAQLEQKRSTVEQLENQMAVVPEKRQALQRVDREIEELEKKRVYQQRVQDKGTERRDFRGRLEEKQGICQEQLEELRQKLKMLQSPGAACPLCERELDEHHRERVMGKTQSQYQENEQQLWNIREQIATCEGELQLLREEYTQLTQELAPYDQLQQELGQLESFLEATGEIYSQLQQIKLEIESLERSFVVGSQLERELTELDQLIADLNYEEQTHTLVRKEVEKWRWAEIKQAKIEEARGVREKIAAVKPQCEEKIASLQRQKEEWETKIRQQIGELDREIAQLGYNDTQHNQLIAQLRQGTTWHLRHKELEQAKTAYPQVQQRLEELTQVLKSRLEEKATLEKQINTIVLQMAEMGDKSGEIKALEQQTQQRRRQLDTLIGQRGSLQQELTQLELLAKQHEDSCQQLKNGRRQYIVYQELAQAFGKNGIQALTIENILPQLESQANQILARLTDNQLHIQFLTQKAASSRSKKNAKLIDTLEIAIADTRGTRAYETYSGGEAFRINFAIRLALAQLLAQRAGTEMQMLIIDEGFSSQDKEGCERLIAAINAIAADFSCILAITHMAQFKAAFQNRIEVLKGDGGSQLRILN